MQIKLNRREALVAGSGMLASAVLSSQAQAMAPTSGSDTPWIDAHSHIWTPDTSKFKLRETVTPDQLAPHSFTDEELMAVATPEGVGRVVLIQHWPYHGWDNSYLIDAWQRHPEKFRIVGMIDDARSDTEKQMKALLKQGVTGFRINPGITKGDWLGTAGMQQMWKTAATTRQPMCCLINPENLAEVGAMCTRFPETPVVIDHFARIGVTGEVKPAELKSLCDLAKHRLVKVKISAYYALGKKQPPHEELVPMIRQLFDAYGADRLMWASDCPYQIDGKSTYRSSISLIRDHIDFVTKEERTKLLCTTAESTFFFV